MHNETYNASALEIANCTGNLTLEHWNEPQFAIESEAAIGAERAENGTLTLRSATGDIRVRVPVAGSVSVEHQHGYVSAALDGGTLRLREIYGPVNVTGVSELIVLADREPRTIDPELRRARRDIVARNIGSADIEAAHGSLSIDGAERAMIGDVGGSADLRSVAGELRSRAIGGSCDIHAVGGAVALGDIGGSCTIIDVRGRISVRAIGGTATFRNTGPVVGLSAIGGSLQLQDALFANDGVAQLTVGGSARIELPAEPNVTIRAIAGGRITGRNGVSGPGMRTVVYGNGDARLNVTVGGSLTLV